MRNLLIILLVVFALGCSDDKDSVEDLCREADSANIFNRHDDAVKAYKEALKIEPTARCARIGLLKAEVDIASAERHERELLEKKIREEKTIGLIEKQIMLFAEGQIDVTCESCLKRDVIGDYLCTCFIKESPGATEEVKDRYDIPKMAKLKSGFIVIKGSASLKTVKAEDDTYSDEGVW